MKESRQDYICFEPHETDKDFGRLMVLDDDPDWVRKLPRTYDTSVMLLGFQVKVGTDTLVEAVDACLEIDAEIRGGVPVVKDTRIPVSLLLASIRDSDLLPTLAGEIGVETDFLVCFFNGLANAFAMPRK